MVVNQEYSPRHQMERHGKWDVIWYGNERPDQELLGELGRDNFPINAQSYNAHGRSGVPVERARYLKYQCGARSYFVKKKDVHFGRLDATVMQELGLANAVATVAENPKLQKRAKELGFKGIRVVKPICGIISDEIFPDPDKSRIVAKKYMIYPFIRGRGVYFYISAMSSEAIRNLRLLIDDVATMFIGNPDFVSSSDFGINQIVIGDDGFVYITDLEYFKLKPSSNELAINL